MPDDHHSITVEPHTDGFRLLNHGAVAGARLYKGEIDKKGIHWPFKSGEQWMCHKTKAAAEKAAQKLQEYLDQIHKFRHGKKE